MSEELESSECQVTTWLKQRALISINASDSDLDNDSHTQPGLLASNEVPLDAELPSIRDFISRAQSTLDALNAHIEQLVLCRDTTAERIRQHVAVLSPARRVPADVWREIFPWVATYRHVCRSWREVSLSNPLLWNTFEIVRPSPLSDTHPMPMSKSQLLRAPSVPLNVSLDLWHGDMAETALLDELMSHSHRWRTLNIRFRVDRATDVLLRLKDVRGRISQLRTSELSIDSRQSDGEQAEDCDLLSVAPSLRKVSLTNGRTSSPSLRFHLPWAQMTHCDGKFSKDVQLDVLSAACNLIECCLAFTDPDSPSFAAVARTIILPHLRRLRVQRADFLHHLTAPSLQQVRTGVNIDSLLPFIHRSKCNLTKLVITQCWSENPDTIPSVLQASPNLETLIYIPDSPEESTPIWLSMTMSPPTFDLCPVSNSSRGDGIRSRKPASMLFST
ncbi:hypothetical protein FB45DRAFT_1006798 [Roridomyces roridus]|uniref:F-box domain-containing protein n=1 Tax=Roridomyces roridus TaxID=1738132 RepID=A0AAD7FF17_9AGAR|nr:hypothetical protein FB45DRAFT_1006798 [Roridomyces roridus]